MHMIELLHAAAPVKKSRGLVEYGGHYMPIPRPTIMSSRSVGVNPYTSVASVRGGEEPGRLGTASGEGGDLPYWLGWGGRSLPVKVVSCSGRPAKPVCIAILA